MRWEKMDTLGLTLQRWLGIEIVERCLFVAYTLLRVKGNDEDECYLIC